MYTKDACLLAEFTVPKGRRGKTACHARGNRRRVLMKKLLVAFAGEGGRKKNAE